MFGLRVFSCLFLFAVMMPLRGEEVIFDFSGGKALASEVPSGMKSGWDGQIVVAGLRTVFAPWHKGDYERPAVSVLRRDMKNVDWRKYRSVVVRITNLEPESSPYLELVFRGDKTAVFRQRVRGNCTTDCVVRLDRLAERVSLDKIDMLQIAYPRPAQKTALLLHSIVLEGVPVDEKMALTPRRYDLAAEIASGTSGWKFVGDGALKFPQSKIMELCFNRYESGQDKWPCLFGSPDGRGSLAGGDFSTKTHFLLDFEREKSIDNLNVHPGLTFIDGQGKKFWSGFGACSEGRTVMKIPFFQMGFDLSDIREMSIVATTPSTTQKFKIYRFELIFQPDAVAEPVLASLRTLARKELSPVHRRQVEASIKKIKELDLAVDRPEAAKNAIEKFFAAGDDGDRTYREISRAHSLEKIRAQYAPGQPFGVGLADSMEKVFLVGGAVNLQTTERVELGLAKNEYESLQLVVCGFAPKSKVKVTAGSVKGPGGVELVPAIGLVGHGRTQRPDYRVDYVGFYPDFIMDGVNTAVVEAGEMVAFWIRFHAGKNIPSGIYRGEIAISGKADNTIKIPLVVKVFAFALPDGCPLPVAYDLDLNNIKHVYHPEDKGHEELWRNRLLDKIVEYKITPDFIYRGLQPSCLPTLKKCAADGILKMVCLGNASVPGKLTNPASSEVKKITEEILEKLRRSTESARRSGLERYGYVYGFDEAIAGPVMDYVFTAIKQRYPALPIMTTAGIDSAENPYVKSVDIQVFEACAFAGHPEVNAALRRQGKQVWWYVCNFPRPPEVGLLLESPGTAPRLLMGMMAQKYRPDGFLYYETILWNQKPRKPVVGDAPRTDWDPATFKGDNGDGNLFVPGATGIFPTIRVENYRDGVEDLWYCRLLTDLIKKAETDSRVDKALLVEAKTALEVPDDIVRSTTEYTSDPLPLRRHRAQLAAVIEKMVKVRNSVKIPGETTK